VKTLLQHNRLVLIAESEDEQTALAAWQSAHQHFVFAAGRSSAGEAILVSLGPRPQACREPINVTSLSPEPIRLIANFAAAPFELDGMRYACVEAFWQSLRFPIDERPRIAALDGAAAKRESAKAPYGTHVSYGGESIPVGTFRHWQLMRRACRAKFEQNENARAALLATGGRPLIHKLREDSRTIPGVIMAEIWMALRARLAGRKGMASRERKQ
jgi:predicted NAD-dependent protein-ADP-ribosyltransferase YbiA (DUF1768 family)